MELDPSNVVKVIEVCKVTPAPNRSPETRTTFSDVNYLPLTFFDALWLGLGLAPIQFVFFYQIDDLSLSVFSDNILPKLKHALSLTLQYYPQLAGYLTWHPDTGNPVIRFDPDNDGIFLTVAESTAHFHFLSTHDVKEANVFHSLFSDFPVSENQATIVSLQVTLFPGYGFSIGYTAHHAALDGKSASLFFKSWAKICEFGSLTSELTPVFDRTLIDDPLDICTIFTDISQGYPRKGRTLKLFDKKIAPGLFRRTFQLNRQQIGHIKSKIPPGDYVSSFTAVCSYILTCLIKAEGDDITNENVNLSIGVDCRARLEPPIPGNYIGNCVAFRLASAKVVSLKGGEGLATAATAIKEAVRSLPKGVVKGAEKWVSEAVSALSGNKYFGISGSPLFDLYGADFGWGRPTKVEMASIDNTESIFSLCDARYHENGGMEIGIVLSKPKIESFASIFVKGLEEFAK